MKTIKTLTLLIVLLLPLSVCDSVRAAGLLKVAFLDVGQGDAIYIEAPNGAQMVIDGGPEGSLADPLSLAMPFGDRSINVLMVTNPDTDHYAGFLDVVRTYDIGAVVESGTSTKTATFEEFQTELATRNIPAIRAWKGMTIDLDKQSGVTFTVLFPDRDVSSWTTNDGSIQGILKYGKSQIMFTGDGTKKTEGIVLAQNSPDVLRSDILKVGHHGSATSSLDSFVVAVDPKWAVISAGFHNKYGLPKQVSLDTFARHNIAVERTDEKGTIVFTSDGTEFVESN
jgi:competence protein ComEC